MRKKGLCVISAYIETFIYPTEDKEKALAALINLTPPEIRDRISIEKTSFRSHYRYSLEKVTVKLSEEDAAFFARYLDKLLDDETKQEIFQTLETRTDDRNLYLRVSKQEAFEGKARLYYKDPGGQIRIRITYSTNYLPKGGLVRAIREKGIGISG
ncbi:MAG: hypothetical protein DRO00_06995 [Thermoproteota archaeon]|nr:MAG: hypothetical protein DRO00_06995 [Candidatus Korarchaeota archaeon]